MGASRNSYNEGLKPFAHYVPALFFAQPEKLIGGIRRQLPLLIGLILLPLSQLHPRYTLLDLAVRGFFTLSRTRCY